ncbi:MAG: hypothetical protein WD200_00010 [Candidatus Andersenbacteria bacterium]
MIALRKSEQGLTFIELSIGIALASLLLVALLRFLTAGFPLSRITFLQANSNETARVQLTRIARELRRTRNSDTGGYALIQMLPQKIVFYANVDSDPATERVRYELTGTDLERGVINPSGSPLIYDPATEQSSVITRHIRNGSDPLFIYYNGNYPADTVALTPIDVTEVKYIEFRLLIDADADREPAPVEIQSQVQIRNLKTNLGQEAD